MVLPTEGKDRLRLFLCTPCPAYQDSFIVSVVQRIGSVMLVQQGRFGDQPRAKVGVRQQAACDVPWLLPVCTAGSKNLCLAELFHIVKSAVPDVSLQWRSRPPHSA